MSSSTRVTGVGSLIPVSDIGELHTQALPDVFSQKVGNWAFTEHAPATANSTQELPSAFALRPVDGTVMDYLEETLSQSLNLPGGHWYDHSLRELCHGVTDPTVKAILEQDIELRDYLRARRVGEVYD